MIGGRLVQEPFRAMGTDCVVAVTTRRADLARASRALAAARREVAQCENVLSRFRQESDLSRLNDAGGEWLAVDRRLIHALRLALRMRELTGGRFDPTILPALNAAGYDRSFEQLEPRPAVAAAGWHPNATVQIDADSLRVCVEPGAAIDLGGIGKGFAAERALRAMRDEWLEVPGGLVDLGGDIVVWGDTPEGGPWQLAIADPRVAGSRLGTLAISGGAVATSGPGVRRFGPDEGLHHLIDPATGMPAAGPLAVTVVGQDAAEAEAFATALAITPIDEAAAWLSARPSLSALVVPREGSTFAIGDLPLLATPKLVEVIA
jgi:thiamine biosynthesis lipoprotein